MREGGIVGLLHCAADAKHQTTVIMLNGSDGGTPSAKDAADLAASGYTVLALACFKNRNGRPKGLPPSLKVIPLEYFYKAIDWLKQRPEVDARRIVLIGQSRGAELALLLASQRPDIAGVVAFAQQLCLARRRRPRRARLDAERSRCPLSGLCGR